ncbi:MAG TPA: DUF6519 domain-containing protein [Candidatus Cybelea sp.]|nr:DUF6519 domain-containing protein [Candidatus Cybelea sp.]
MKGDFTRVTFDPGREFYRVLMQQGRLQLDADWNEQIAILLHRFETLAADVFGAHGGPATECGFAVFQDNKGIWISRGRYYVEGLQCENHDVLKLEPPQSAKSGQSQGAYLVYLDAYEQYIAAAQDPSITDVALGTLDTAGRTRIFWTVAYWPIAGKGSADQAYWNREWEQALPEISASGRRGLLQARVSSQFGYTGSQNQLYRVEIQQGGTYAGDGLVTWKWSRENGSVAFAAGIADASVQVKGGAAAIGAFSVGDWVEIVSNADVEDSMVKRPLHQVVKVDSSSATLTLDASPGAVDLTASPIVRRWDQRAGSDQSDPGSSDGCLPLLEGQWLPIESGIEVSFGPPKAGDPAHQYRGGDYWVIPARAVTAAIEWPKNGDQIQSLPPRGVKHRYAPLSVLVAGDGGFKPVYDYRIRCKPLSMAT